jgi:uncharacterized membrane protein YhaH (DUF805 family)
MSIIQMLFSAKGRIRRRDYWLYNIGLAIVGTAIEFAGHQVLTHHPAAQYFKDMADWMTLKPEPFNVFIWVMIVVVGWPGVCLASKRWHDRGKSGWLSALGPGTNLLTLVAQLLYGPTTAHPNLLIYFGIALIGFAVSIWIFVECGCLDGTKGDNRYGPSPKGVPSQAEVF